MTAQRLVFLVGAMLSLAWLGLCAYAAARAGVPAGALDVAGWAALAAGFAAPLCLLWLVLLTAARAAEGQSRAAALSGLLGAQLGDIVHRLDEAEARSGLLIGAVDARLDRLHEAAEAIARSGDRATASVAALGSALTAAEEQAHRVDALAAASAAMAEGRLEAVETLLAALWGRNDEVQEQAGQLLADLREAVAALAGAVGAARAVIDEGRREVEASVAHGAGALDRQLGQVRAALDAQAREFDARMRDAGARLESLGAAAADRLSARIGDLVERSAPLDDAFAHAADQIGAAVSALLDGREALQTSADRLRPQLDEAGSLLAGIRDETEAASVAASTKLIEALGRARDVAQAASGAMRRALDDTIDEAHAALSRAGEDAARRTFAEPLEAEIERIGTAADRGVAAVKSASDQLSRHLLGLSRLVHEFEARIKECDERLRARTDADMPARASELIRRIEKAAVPIAQQLGADISDATWKAFQRGDRSIFARRTVRLISSAQSRQLDRFAREDDVFRAAAANYVADFEALMRLVGTTSGGEALSTTLLSSDVGKLYAALSGALAVPSG